MKEDIQWKFIDFNDNQPCIALIEGKLGVLDLLDEESRLPSGTDASFVTKLLKQHATADAATTSALSKPKFAVDSFCVHHYAHDVTYDATNFLDKNRDTMSEEIVSLLVKSSFDFCAQLFSPSTQTAPLSSDATLGGVEKIYSSQQAPVKPSDGRGRGGAQKVTLGSSFKNSLSLLMSTINATNAHYIRCIKPNDAKRPFLCENKYVLQQLRACGVLETIRISCAGFPSRFNYAEFANRYRMLPHSSKRSTDARVMSQVILSTALKDQDKFQLGKSKVFLRAGQVCVPSKIVVLLFQLLSLEMSGSVVTCVGGGGNNLLHGAKITKSEYLWICLFLFSLDSSSCLLILLHST